MSNVVRYLVTVDAVSGATLKVERIGESGELVEVPATTSPAVPSVVVNVFLGGTPAAPGTPAQVFAAAAPEKIIPTPGPTSVPEKIIPTPGPTSVPERIIPTPGPTSVPERIIPTPGPTPQQPPAPEKPKVPKPPKAPRPGPGKKGQGR